MSEEVERRMSWNKTCSLGIWNALYERKLFAKKICWSCVGGGSLLLWLFAVEVREERREESEGEEEVGSRLR